MTWQNVATIATTPFNIGNLCSEIALETPIEYLTFNTTPLALVCAMIDADQTLVDIHSTLEVVGSQTGFNADQVVEEKHHAQANEIYMYFARKHTMRRLKGEFISNWMLSVDEIVDNRLKIKKSSLKILVTLPKFYKENRELEPIMRDHKSFTELQGRNYTFDEVVTFVKKIERRASKQCRDDYYWKTDQNYLVRISLPINDYGSTAWDLLSKQGKLKMKSPYSSISIYRITGYDFNVIILPNNMEILTV